jgi:5'-nucleotidase / UDP-sugar diphosphatase
MAFMKKSFIGLLSTLVVLFGFSGTFSAQAEETATSKTITILHTNDTHAKVESSDGGMGFAKLATLIKQLEKENPNTLLLDAGDTFHGTPFATLEQGESIAQIFNKLGYDGLSAGNHDFNYGADRLLELKDIVEFPIISANIRYKADNSLFLEPYTIKEIDGIKLGIFGLTTPETHYKTNPKNVEELNFTDPVEEAKAMVEKLEAEGADIIIALTHLGIDESSTDTSIRVAEGAPGIDLIVDGHSHSTLVEGQEAGEDTLIVSAGEHTKNLGVVDLTFEGTNLVDIDAKLITQEEAEDVQEDTEVRALIDSIGEGQDVLLSEIVGETSVDLEGAREYVRTGETNLGNLLTDAMVAATGADVALTNGGGIRASIPKGKITKGQVIDVLPFGNYVVTKKVTGADLKAALEHGTSDYPNSKGAFPHVSGVTFEIDINASAGNRVKNLKVGEEPVDLSKEYVLATNDFMAIGGDDYTMLADGELLNEYAALDEILIAYIQENSPVNPTIENRITLPLPFGDVSKERWSYEFIKDLFDQKLVKGTTVTTFSPSETVSRVQFASMLARAFDLTATEDSPFTDIGKLPEDIQGEIAAAYEAGFIKGVSEKSFDPNKPITREQMMLILNRAYQWTSGKAYVAEGKAPFSDIAKLSKESINAITMGYELEIINGFGDEFKPLQKGTREQSAKVISLFLKTLN